VSGRGTAQNSDGLYGVYKEESHLNGEGKKKGEKKKKVRGLKGSKLLFPSFGGGEGNGKKGVTGEKQRLKEVDRKDTPLGGEGTPGVLTSKYERSSL